MKDLLIELWNTVALPLLVGAVVLILLVMTGCQTVDKALLNPVTDEHGQQVMVDQEGTLYTQAEIDAMARQRALAMLEAGYAGTGTELEAAAKREIMADLEPAYDGPRDFSEEPWGAVEYGGVSLGGLAAIAASAWWFIRRRRKPAPRKPDPEVSTR
jgi:hypothetical protein